MICVKTALVPVIRLAGLGVCLMLVAGLAACGPSTPNISPLFTPTTGLEPAPSPLSTPTAGEVPAAEAETPTTTQDIVPLQDIIANPDRYIGREVTIEGVLEARGQMPNARFFLRGPAGELLEVTPWAPPESIQPPQAGGTRPTTMGDYLGKQLRLTGVVQQGPQGPILEGSPAGQP